MEDANHYWPSQRRIIGGIWGTMGDMGVLLFCGGGITKSGSSRHVCWGARARRPPLGVCVIRLLWG